MTYNIYAATLRSVSTCKKTENGANAFSTTDSACVDLFAVIGALRNGGNYEQRLHDLIDGAYAEDPTLLAKMLFYARDVRGGLGERKVFRDALFYCANKYPDILKNNLVLIPEYGRWDDLFSLIGTQFEKEMWEILLKQFLADESALAKGSAISLLAKWLPSADTSSKDTRALAYLCASHFDMTVYEYKRRVRALRKHLNLLETSMSSKKWETIDYGHVPSQAHCRHVGAFLRNDERRYKDYLAAVQAGKRTIKTATLFPYEIIEKLRVSRYDNTEGVNAPYETMWKNLPNYVSDPNANILIMADTSGSMYGRPMATSTSLAIYFAERNHGPFGNLYLTFDTHPRLISIDPKKSLTEKYIQLLNGPWGGSTNLVGSFELLLDVAVKTNAKPEDMPKSLVIITDMEINAGGDDSKVWNTIVDTMRDKYAQAGYVLPNVIFWNVASRHDTYLAKSNYKGIQLVSGSSPSVFRNVMGFFNGMTPLDCVKEVLNTARYAPITVAQ